MVYTRRMEDWLAGDGAVVYTRRMEDWLAGDGAVVHTHAEWKTD